MSAACSRTTVCHKRSCAVSRTCGSSRSTGGAASHACSSTRLVSVLPWASSCLWIRLRSLDPLRTAAALRLRMLAQSAFLCTTDGAGGCVDRTRRPGCRRGRGAAGTRVPGRGGCSVRLTCLYAANMLRTYHAHPLLAATRTTVDAAAARVFGTPYPLGPGSMTGGSRQHRARGFSVVSPSDRSC